MRPVRHHTTNVELCIKRNSRVYFSRLVDLAQA